MSSSLTTFLSSPVFIVLIWPIAFVALGLALRNLAKGRVIQPKGTNKYRVIFRAICNEGSESSLWREISPVDLAWLKSEMSTYDVQDLEVMQPSRFRSLDFGIDLCAAAILATLTIVFMISNKGLHISVNDFMMVVVVLILQFNASVAVVTLLRRYDPVQEQQSVWLANTVGIFAIAVSVSLLFLTTVV